MQNQVRGAQRQLSPTRAQLRESLQCRYSSVCPWGSAAIHLSPSGPGKRGSSDIGWTEDAPSPATYLFRAYGIHWRPTQVALLHLSLSARGNGDPSLPDFHQRNQQSQGMASQKLLANANQSLPRSQCALFQTPTRHAQFLFPCHRGRQLVVRQLDEAPASADGVGRPCTVRLSFSPPCSNAVEPEPGGGGSSTIDRTRTAQTSSEAR